MKKSVKQVTKQLTAALLLGLMASAGAQVASCTAPTNPDIPKFATGGWTLNTYRADTGAQQAFTPGILSAKFATNTDATQPSGSAETFLYLADNLNPGVNLFASNYTWAQNLKYVATSPAISIGKVRYIQLGFAFANFGTNGGDSTTVDFQYNGVTYLTIVTPGPNDTDPITGHIYAAGDATLYDNTGNPVSSLTVKSKSQILNNPTAVVDTQASYNDDVNARQMFYIRLPDTVLTSGPLTIIKEAPATPAGAYATQDDFRFWIPKALSTSLCIRKELDKGTAPNSFTFTTNATQLDNTGVADTGYPNQITVPVTSLTTPYAKNTTPSGILAPSSVGFTETNTGFTITKTVCDRPYMLDASPSNPTGTQSQATVVVSGKTSTISNLPIGVMTTCTVYNEDNTQIQFPKFKLVKNFTTNKNIADKATIKIAETGGGNSTLDVVNTDKQTGNTTYTGTVLNFATTNGTNTVSAGKPATITMSEALLANDTSGNAAADAANYTKTYSCTNAAIGTGTTLTTASTALPASNNFTIDPHQGDDITCTIVNALTVAAPSTTVTLTKTGNTYSTVGKEVTYTVTATNSTATAVDAVLTDTLDFKPAAAKVTPSDSGTYDANTGIVTWPKASVPANNGTLVRTVKVYMPDSTPADTAAGTATSYTGPKTVKDTAGMTTYTTGTSTPIENSGNTTSNIAVTTNVVFVGVTKTVQNMTTGSAVGTTAPGKPGDTLEYCLKYSSNSPAALTSMKITDTVQAGQTFKAGAYSGNDLKITQGTATTTYSANEGTGAAATAANPNPASVQKSLNVAANESGTVCFQTTIN